MKIKKENYFLVIFFKNDFIFGRSTAGPFATR